MQQPATTHGRRRTLFCWSSFGGEGWSSQPTALRLSRGTSHPPAQSAPATYRPLHAQSQALRWAPEPDPATVPATALKSTPARLATGTRVHIWREKRRITSRPAMAVG